MVPVALVAAVLVPAATAQTLHAGGLIPATASSGTVAAPVPTPLHSSEAATLQLLQQWAERHALEESGGPQDASPQPGSDPTPPSQQGDPQSPVVQQARAEAGKAKGDALSVQAQAAEKAKEAQNQAAALAAALPKDPLAFAAGTAKQAATAAAGALPPLFASPSMQPQASSVSAVAPGQGIPPILAGSLLIAGAAGATFFAFWLAGSSGTAATGAAAKSTELRRLLPFASPLFTRFEKETVLGHPRREALYALILQQPGVSLQALGEATGLSRTAVLHHLRLLEMQHLVVSKRMGRSRHYFENGGRYGRDAKEAYAILQNPRSKEVADYIRGHPGAMQKQLCQALAIQPSIAHWHVRRLQAAQLVDCVRQGRAVTYFPGSSLLEVAAQPSLPPLPEMPAPAAVPFAAILPS